MNIELYLKVDFLGTGWVYKRPITVVVDLYVDHNASGIIVVSNITSEMTPEKSRK